MRAAMLWTIGLLACAALVLSACSDDGVGRICAIDADCSEGEICVERRCVPVSDLDGYDGGEDDGGTRPDYGDLGSWDAGGPSSCVHANECEAGEQCFNGFCVLVNPDPACSDDEDDDCEDDTYCEPSLGGCVSWDARPGEVVCEHIPPEGQFTPVEEWAWEQPAEAPESDEVIMTPVVIDLSGLAGSENFVVPAVVFNSFNAQDGYSANGVLRAVRGDTGEPIFSVTDPAYATHPVSGIAAGDLDGDGLPELVTGKSGGGDLICFDHSGQFLWQTELGDLLLGWGGPAIANIDATGPAEIIVGAAVFNSDGSLRWRKTGARGENYAPPSSAHAPFSVPADVDGDGFLEIVTGDTLYSHEGEVIWDTGYGDGFVAVGEFNGGGAPEIVVVSRGTVRLQSSTTGSIFWLRDEAFLNSLEACSPSCGMLGPPTVADFDGDGYPDIGVAGAGVYLVLNTYGSVLWSVVTRDETSNITGSAVFDFEGDRRAEVVYADEISLKVLRGSDGTVLYEQPHSSVTACEYPVIADVDGDYNAEIIVAQNDLIADAPHKFKGIRVFGDAEDNWVNTRRVWNQHAYSVTNVEENGQIPILQAPNWEDPLLNNFRQNVQGGGLFDAPDLTARGLGTRGNDCGAGIVFYAAVSNRGEQAVPPGVPVAFYHNDPRQGGTLLGLNYTSARLAPGQGEVVVFRWDNPPPETDLIVFVVADDLGGGAQPAGIHSECREGNNLGRFEPVRCSHET